MRRVDREQGRHKETLAAAQKVFSVWARQHSSERRTSELLERLNAAFFKSLDELTIARSRKHIQKYYQQSIAQLGGFPKRQKPISLYPDIDLRGRFLSYDKLNDEIVGYKLSLFNPSKYVYEKFRKAYQTSTRDPFTQADREMFLIGMMKVNFLKRLESSVKSFEITMDRTIAKIEALENKIRDFQALSSQNPEAGELELHFGDPGQDEELEEALLVGEKFTYQLRHLRLHDWLKDLKKDKDQLRINYDIHWNPVRIIQRFGRIDRIGSASHSVQLVNFWPTEDLNKYINLKNRVEARMALVDIAATFEDNILQNAEIEDLISQDLRYRDKQLLRLRDEVLDIEDLGDSVSLTEFTLDDFRLELLKYIEANRAALEDAPFGLYTVVPPHPDYKVIGPGVIFCFRQEQPSEVPAAAGSSADKGRATEGINPLQPYFLVYVLDDGNVRFGFAHPKQILDIYRLLCSGKDEPYTQLCNLFDQQTNHGTDM